MNYFILAQDERIPNVVKPQGVTKSILDVTNIAEWDEHALTLLVEDKKHNDYIDFIQSPMKLLSDDLKKLVEKYDSTLPMHPVVLIDQKKGQQSVYWRFLPPEIDCLSDQSEFHPGGLIKKLVIDEEPARLFPMFTVNGIREQFVIINLALAESILRRSFRGIHLQKVQTTGYWNDSLHFHRKESFKHEFK